MHPAPSSHVLPTADFGRFAQKAAALAISLDVLACWRSNVSGAGFMLNATS
jgi:hypothetical protein